MHIGDVERVLEAFASRAGTFEESLGKAIARFDEVRVSAAKEMEAMNAVSEEGRMERALESSGMSSCATFTHSTDFCLWSSGVHFSLALSEINKYIRLNSQQH